MVVKKLYAVILRYAGFKAYEAEYFFLADHLFKLLADVYSKLEQSSKLSSREYWRWGSITIKQAGGYHFADKYFEKAFNKKRNSLYLVNYLNVQDSMGQLNTAKLHSLLPLMKALVTKDKHVISVFLLLKKYKVAGAEYFYKNISTSLLPELQKKYIAFREKSFFEEFSQHSDKLFNDMVDYLKANKGKIALVGNSSCEKGLKKGQLIDAHNIVIRFNNYHITPDFAVDYGSKVSIWVRGGNRRIEDRQIEDNIYVLFALRDLLFKKYRLDYLLKLQSEGKLATFIPTIIYQELMTKLGSTPSVGILMLYIIDKYVGGLSADNVFGFSFIDHLDPHVSSHYFEKHQTNLSHNWRGERQLYEEILQQHDKDREPLGIDVQMKYNPQ